MPFCTECGGTVSKTQKFCAQCGTKLPGLSTPEPAALRPTTDPVPERRVGVIRPTPEPGLITEVGRDVAFPRSGSMLLADPADSPEPAPSVQREIPLLPLVAGLLCALTLSALVGYWWFKGRGSATSATVVEATEQAVDPPGVQRPAGELLRAPGVEQLWALVEDSTRDTTTAADLLGPPDQKTAVIAPGGTLAVAYRAGPYFYNGAGPDLEIHGPDAEHTRYTIFAREDAAGQWLRFDVNNKGFRNGVASHDMGHHGMERARQIMIKNEGGANLTIDALTPLHTQPEAHDDDHARVPATPRRRP